jgi:hypothetical protein
MRSSWEVRYAEALDTAGRTWWYEPDRLAMPDGSTYIPDFLVSGIGYVEIKGYKTDIGMKKAEYADLLIYGKAALDAEVARLNLQGIAA